MHGKERDILVRILESGELKKARAEDEKQLRIVTHEKEVLDGLLNKKEDIIRELNEDKKRRDEEKVRLNAQLQAQNQQNHTLNQMLRKKDKEIEELKKQLEEQKKSCSDLIKQLQRISGELSVIKQQIAYEKNQIINVIKTINQRGGTLSEEEISKLSSDTQDIIKELQKAKKTQDTERAKSRAPQFGSCDDYTEILAIHKKDENGTFHNDVNKYWLEFVKYFKPDNGFGLTVAERIIHGPIMSYAMGMVMNCERLRLLKEDGKGSEALNHTYKNEQTFGGNIALSEEKQAEFLKIIGENENGIDPSEKYYWGINNKEKNLALTLEQVNNKFKNFEQNILESIRFGKLLIIKRVEYCIGERSIGIPSTHIQKETNFFPYYFTNQKYKTSVFEGGKGAKKNTLNLLNKTTGLIPNNKKFELAHYANNGIALYGFIATLLNKNISDINENEFTSYIGTSSDAVLYYTYDVFKKYGYRSLCYLGTNHKSNICILATGGKLCLIDHSYINQFYDQKQPEYFNVFYTNDIFGKSVFRGLRYSGVLKNTKSVRLLPDNVVL